MEHLEQHRVAGKVYVLFYVDPDEKDTNNEASDALDREKFPSEKFQTVGIINMAATWLPNFAISSASRITEALSRNHLCAGLQESAGECLEDCRRQQ